jgi:GNAT superfamily N-acetyltransferase
MSTISPPSPIEAHHRIEAFDSGCPVIDSWLINHAVLSQLNRTDRTSVLSAGDEVTGFYTLAQGCVYKGAKVVPVIVLKRLAVCQSAQGQGLGRDLLGEAVVRAQIAASSMGFAALLAHAIDEKARQFYLKAGFVDSGIHPLVMLLKFAE